MFFLFLERPTPFLLGFVRQRAFGSPADAIAFQALDRFGVSSHPHSMLRACSLVLRGMDFALFSSPRPVSVIP